MPFQGSVKNLGRILRAGHVDRGLNPLGTCQCPGDGSTDILCRHDARVDNFQGTFFGQKATSQGLFAFQAAVEFFDAERYNAAGSLQDNILFGKLVYGQAEGGRRIGALIADTLDTLGLRGAVLEAGLEFEVGVGGARLSTGQRQKLGIARALLKRAELIILNETTSALDPSAQDRLAEKILDARGRRGIVWIVNRVTMASKFDRVIVMDEGRLSEQGSFDELDKDGTALRGLLESA